MTHDSTARSAIATAVGALYSGAGASVILLNASGLAIVEFTSPTWTSGTLASSQSAVAVRSGTVTSAVMQQNTANGNGQSTATVGLSGAEVILSKLSYTAGETVYLVGASILQD